MPSEAGTSTIVGSGASAVAQPTALSSGYGQYWSGLTWPNDQITEVTAKTLTSESTSLLALILRQQAGVATRYECDISAGTIKIFKVVSGTATQLGSSGSATLGANDVWTFAAIGVGLSVYQNGKRIANVADATITGGSPGFLEFSTSNITHVQVSSWRGYSAVQQDGIWQKQGVVIAPLAADIPGATYNGIEFHMTPIYEGNAQILSGNVYKLIIDNFVNAYYMESSDGITWSRMASPVISTLRNAACIKNGSTYYLYGQASFGAAVKAYTSSDMVTWTLQNATALQPGTTGAWDEADLFPFFSIIVVGGTFYGYYGASHGLSIGPFSLGLATSPDGITWTKYASNPVITGQGNSCGLVSSGGKYYLWAQSNQVGLGNSGAPFFDPTESVRYESTDLHSWTNPQHSTHNTGLCESLNSNTGYSLGGYLVNVNGKTYNYLNIGMGDSLPPLAGQIQLATAPATIAAVVKHPETAQQQVGTDNFGGTLANWTTPTTMTGLQIVGGALEAGATATDCMMLRTAETYGNTQYSSITIGALTASGYFAAPTVYGQSSGENCYAALIQGPTASAGTQTIVKKVAGVNTQIGTSISCTPHVGDVFTLGVQIGSDSFPVLFLYQNGFLILQVQDYSTAFTSGNPGILMKASATLANAQVSAWAGGNANILPNFAAGAGLLLGVG